MAIDRQSRSRPHLQCTQLKPTSHAGRLLWRHLARRLFAAVEHAPMAPPLQGLRRRSFVRYDDASNKQAWPRNHYNDLVACDHDVTTTTPPLRGAPHAIPTMMPMMM